MTVWRTLLEGLGTSLAFAAVLGLVWRQRLRRCYAFGLYLSLVVGYDMLVMANPTSHTWPNYLAKETAVRLASVLVAIEIAIRMFRSLPRAAQAARLTILGVLAATALVVWEAPTTDPPRFGRATPLEIAAFEATLTLLPRVAYGTAWLFTALVMVALRFALPMDRVHLTILMGCAAYMMVFAIAIGPARSPVHHASFNVVLPSVWIAVLAAWAYVAWAPEPKPPAPDHVVKRLWPWR